MQRGKGRSSSSRRQGHGDIPPKSRQTAGFSSAGRSKGRGLIDLRLLGSPNMTNDPMDQPQTSESKKVKTIH